MKLIFIAAILLLTQSAIAQKESSSDNVTKEKTANNNFYFFEIPSVINGANLDPSPISNISSSLTDSKISAKLGFPGLFKSLKDINNTRFSGFVQPSFSATNGVATLFKTKSPSLEYNFNAGVSIILFHRKWYLLDKDGNITSKTTSEEVGWINIIGSIGQGNYNLLTTDGSFNNLLNKRPAGISNIYLSVNDYFYSLLPKYKWQNLITSFGIGYAKTNNYSDLKKATLQEGKIMYSSDSTKYQSVVTNVSGVIGTFQQFEGLSSFGEAFIPICRNKKYGSIYWGLRGTLYNLDNSNIIFNSNSGFYFTIKDGKQDGDKPAKDVVNFAITAEFNQLAKHNLSNYFVDYFDVKLQAAVPLTFR